VPKSERQQPEFVRRSARWWPLLLVLLALADLKTEIVLLLDHFTLTSLLFAMRHHVLAVAVLMGSPSLWRRYA
jgi:hypothetical protein